MNPPEVPQALLTEWPDGSAVREELLTLYECHTGNPVSREALTPTQEDDVVRWLNMNMATFMGSFLRSRHVRVPAYSPSLSSKVGMLAQYHCPICATRDPLFPVVVIPIRIRPESKQALKQRPRMRAAFERAIRHRFEGTNPSFSSEMTICLLIVFVVRNGSAEKDLDNMAKAIIDAVKGVLFGDDRRIDHLNIIRIKSPDEEFVYLNLRRTLLNVHSDVLVPRMLHSWGGAPLLDLRDFIA